MQSVVALHSFQCCLDLKISSRIINLNKTGIKDIAKALFIAVGRLFVENPETANRSHAKTLAPDFHADDVQPGHTYFMAKTCNNLIGKFVYQIYPLLREYYKDGILVKLNNETSLGFQRDGVLYSITMEPAHVTTRVTCKITGTLSDCS